MSNKEEKKKKSDKWVTQALIISRLKKLFVRSPMYKAVKDAAKVPYQAYNKDGTPSKQKRFQYRCAKCGNLFFDKKIKVGETKKGKPKMANSIEVDHVSPVVPTTGFTDMNTWIEREFVNIKVWNYNINTSADLFGKLQLLCYYCHQAKSQEENSERRKLRKE